MENPRSFLPILGLKNLGRTLLGEKGTKSLVGLRWTWARFWTVSKPLFLVLLPGIGNSNHRATHVSFWLTLIFNIAYMLAFLFVSLQVGKKLDTRRSRSSQSTPIRWWLHQDHSLVVGDNFFSGPSSSIKSTPYLRDVKQGMSMCQLMFYD
jgi:hypothetical protein